MFRMNLAITTAFIVVLLCPSSVAEEVGAFLCSADDPVVASPVGKSFWQLVQKDLAWKPEDGLPPRSNDRIRIGVSFLDGTPSQHEDVRKLAPEWTTKIGAPIEWVFDNKDMNHIRITFKLPNSWSWHGRQAIKNKLSLTEPTMSLGVYNEQPPPSRDRIEQTILHEFGHALALMHEQFNAVGKLTWNRDKVFADVKNSDWCKNDDGSYMGDAKCRKRINDKLIGPDPNQHPCLGAPDFDPTSIMMYDLWPGWTNEYPHGLYIEPKVQPDDLKCVRELYHSILYPEPNRPEPPRPVPHPKEPRPMPRPKSTQRCDCCCCCPRSNFRWNFYYGDWEPDFWGAR